VTGRTVVVTGASSGIGAAAALELAGRGLRVVGVGHDAKRVEKLGAALRQAGGTEQPEPLRADFASQAQVRRLADEVLELCPRIDVLVNNAGIVSKTRELTEDGRERTFAVNHLAPFLLTSLLLPRLRETGSARVVTTSSDAHYRGRLRLDDLDGERRWSSWGSYCDSKLANALFTRALAAREDAASVVAHCLHPGVIRTRLFRGTRAPVRAGFAAASLFFSAPETGAETIVHLATDPEAGEMTGLYWSGGLAATPSERALDDELADGLWARSAQLTGTAG
jgi:NAD(P)-dependent dehydrogenase (short-subunit alcohol dehydrogenase family)